MADEDVTHSNDNGILKRVWKWIESKSENPAKLIKSSPTFTLLSTLGATLGFLVLIATAYQIRIELIDQQAERLIRKEEAISRAWSRLTQRAAGNTGKGQALSFLAKNGIDFSGIDLSCETTGGWKNSSNTCARRVHFSGLNLSGKSGTGVNIDTDGFHVFDVDFADGFFLRFRMENGSISDGNFSRTILSTAFIANSHITAGWNGGLIRFSDIVNSILDVPWADGVVVPKTGELGPALQGVHVSGSVLPESSVASSEPEALYAWADWPPLIVNKNGDREPIEAYSDRVIWCVPPSDEEGTVVPRLERPRIIHTYGDTVTFRNCGKDITYSQAKSMYPKEHSDREAACSGIKYCAASLFLN